MKNNYVYSDDSASYDEDEYDRLNDATFGSVSLNMNPKGFSFNNAENKYRVEIKGESATLLTNNQLELDKEDITILKNLSINNNQHPKDDLQHKEDDEITTYKTSIVDQFFLWINPQQLYMLSDLHNMNCRKKKLFNYTHIIPTLEDKMLNRIKIKFHASKHLFGVDIANLVQMFQRKLAESCHLIPFNCDYYYWERIYRLNPHACRINRMLIADDMWLPPVPQTFETDKQQPPKPIRPPTIKYEETLGSINLSSVQFPRKIVSCDEENSVDINKINNPELFSDIQKRYYVLSLIDRAIRLAIDYEIKNRVVSYQIQNQQKIEYKAEEMIKFQMSLGDFMLKIVPLYPFILNYGQGIHLFNRMFYLLSDVHKIHISKGIFEALKSNKINPHQYPVILDDECLVNIIMFGLGDRNEMNNHLGCVDFFSNLPTVQFTCTLFFWRFLEMIHTWLIPFGYGSGNAPPPEYTLKFLYLLPPAIQSTRTKQLPHNKFNSIVTTQQKILGAIKGLNYKQVDSPITKQIIDVKDSILNNFLRSKRP